MELNQLTRLLVNFQKIPKPKPSMTFMEISGYPHFENVCSNILKFYLQPQNEHGFKDLILNSLVHIVDEEFQIDCDIERVEVHREVKTISDNRLDLLIETGKYVIGVENKIFHFLNNDLNDYSNTVLSYCTLNNKTPINIILSLNKISNPQDIEKAKADNFKNITYEDLFARIRNNIGRYLSNSNPTYLIYLNDFMRSIQNLKPATMENKLLWSFFQANSESILELSEMFKHYRNSVFAKAGKLKEYLPKEYYAPLATNQWIWDGPKDDRIERFALVHDYKFANYEIGVDAAIDLKGWSIEVVGRDISSRDYLLNYMFTQPNFLKKPYELYEINERIIIERFETEVDLEVVASSLKDILARIENFIKSETES